METAVLNRPDKAQNCAATKSLVTHQTVNAEPPIGKSALECAFDWLDAKTNMPTLDQMRSTNAAWELAQVDSGPLWAAELYPERLATALRMAAEAPENGFGDLLDLALGGSIIAMNAAGEFYYWGRGVAVDRALGEDWFRKSFEEGSQRALLNYGWALVRRNELGLAETVFRSGAEEDWGPALYGLATTLLRRSRSAEARQEARHLLERAAAKGSPSARWKLCRDMARGRFGILEISRGVVLLVEFAMETLEAWDKDRNSVRTAATGETIR